MRRMLTVAVMPAVLAVSLLAGCGAQREANGYNLSDSVRNVGTLTWVRVDSPSNYPTIMHACWDGLGLYIDQDATNSVRSQYPDPTCHGSTVVASP